MPRKLSYQVPRAIFTWKTSLPWSIYPMAVSHLYKWQMSPILLGDKLDYCLRSQKSSLFL